jgi:triacylglycerol esterase/lipase EstA (alpha/beta hydrolase family)
MFNTRRLILMTVFPALLWWCGCSHEVGIRRATAAEKQSYSSIQIAGEDLCGDTVNLLGNYSLTELLDRDPERLVLELTRLFAREPRMDYITALADVALRTGRDLLSENRELAVRYFLSAAMYASVYFKFNNRESSHYDPTGIRMVLVYNAAVSEIFDYLKARQLWDKSGFELSCVLGETVRFEAPDYELPIPKSQIRDVLLCADYRPENLTHDSRKFGIGAPLILDIGQTVENGRIDFAKNQTLPGTFVLKFSELSDSGMRRCRAQVCIVDSQRETQVELDGCKLPLERDLTTPLAYMVKDPPLMNFIAYTLLPGDSQEMQGLYRLGPPDDNRIPVVLVHGLLSDTRTWLQLVNTLQSDDEIGRNYQFLGFSYSSGNPIFYSGWMLRTALSRERARLIAEKRPTDKFDRMVVIGHSMGGLLSRLVVSSSGDVIPVASGKEKFEGALMRFSPEERKIIDEIVHFEPLPFIQRVIFIATPHRGSQLADTWIARFGSSLIQIPKDMLRRNQVMIEALFGDKFTAKTEFYITGVENLNPNSRALKMLNQMPMSDKIIYHSIIGNKNGGGIPGGSDGVVPYSSSHLNNVKSELVVKSGHSAQQFPLAIQEIRRILLEHLGRHPAALDAPILRQLQHGGAGEEAATP